MKTRNSDYCTLEISKLASIIESENSKILALAQSEMIELDVLKIKLTHFDGGDYVNNATTYKYIYKKINNSVHFITIESCINCNCSVVDSDFDWYKTKNDMDNCSAIIKIKTTTREMRRNPKDFYHIS